MIFLIFILTLLGVLSFTYYLLNHTKNEPFSPPPGPERLPIIGNLHQYDFISPHKYLAKLAKTYGPILSLRLGYTSVVVVQSAELAKEVLQIQDLNFCSRPPTFGTSKMSYDGIDIVFSPYNEYFREMKKISIVHLFNTKRVQSFAPIRQEEITRLLNKISSLSSELKLVNMSELVMVYSSSVICKIAFGKRYEDEEGQRSKFHNLLNDAQASFVTFYYRDYFPIIGGILDKLSGKFSMYTTTIKELDMFYERLIQDHLDPNRPYSNKEDILDVLLQLRKQRNFGFEINLNHIKAILMDIFIAGTDTSVAMIIWGMTLLIKHPHVMKKVQGEIRNATKNNDFINEEQVQKLEYFKAMVKETFRLHAAAPLLVARETTRKTKLNGYDILPKTIVYVNAWTIGRDPKLWNDPDVFNPERFIGSTIDVKGQDFELIPFGAGRRICPALHLGHTNVEVTLANLLKDFNWELPKGVKKEAIDMDTLPGITNHKKNPLILVSQKYRP